MQVPLHLVDEEVMQALRSIEDTLGLGLTADLTVDSVELIGSEELGDVTGGQDIVDVDKEFLVDDLRVSHDEEHFSTLDTSLHEEGLDVRPEVTKGVVGGNNNLEDVLVQDEGSELGERLLT